MNRHEHAEWLAAMLEQTAEAIYPEAVADARTPDGVLHKHRCAQLTQRRLNLLSAAAFIKSPAEGRSHD